MPRPLGASGAAPPRDVFLRLGEGEVPTSKGVPPALPGVQRPTFWPSGHHLFNHHPGRWQPPPCLGCCCWGATWGWGNHHPGRQLQLSCPLPEEGQPRKSCHTFRRAAFQLPGVGLSRTGGVAICTGLLGLGPNPATWERAFPEVQVTCTNCINLGNGLHSPTFPGASRVHF